MAIRAGKAMVKVYADNSMLQRGLNQARAKLAAFAVGVKAVGRASMVAGTAIFALGAGAAVALGLSVREFMRFGDQLDKMSKRTGIGVEALSEMSFAAEQSGASLDDLEKATKRMARTISDAKDGLATYVRAFDRIGLSADDLARMSPEDAFRAIGKAIADVEDPLIRAASAQEIFGRAGTMLLPMLKNFEALREEARALGITMTAEDAAAAAELVDAMNRLRRSFIAVKVAIGSALGPVLSELFTDIATRIGPIVNWIKLNKGLVVSVAKLTLGVMGLGAGLLILGVGLMGLGFIISGVAVGLGAIGAVLSAVLSPIGLVIGAFAFLGVQLWRYTSIGQKALAWLGERFAILKADALFAFGGIKDALAAGDLKLAAKILWLGLKVEWARGVLFLKGVWFGLMDKILSAATDAFYGIVMLMATALANIQAAWAELAFGLRAAWDLFGLGIAKAWNFIASGLKAAWILTIGVFADLWHGAIDLVKDIWSGLLDFVFGIVGKIINKIMSMKGVLKHIIPESVFKGLEALAESIKAGTTDRAGAKKTREEAADRRKREQDARLAEVGQGYEEASAEIEAKYAARKQANLDALQEKVRRINEEEQATITALARTADEKNLERRQRYEDKLAESRKKLANAQEELAAAVEEAKGAAEAATETDRKDRAARIDELPDLSKVAGQMEARGTFNAVAAFGLGFGSSVTDRIANASEETAKNTRELNSRDQVEGALAFS